MFDQTPEEGRPGRVPSINVLGGALQPCSREPMTGFYRDGCCNTGREDLGLHTVCVVMTAEFLAFSKAHGNDLSTPMPQYGFAGLKPGDRWCLCAVRWKEALEAGALQGPFCTRCGASRRAHAALRYYPADSVVQQVEREWRHKKRK